MYPNPQDALPLPPRPDVEHYRKRAKELAKACRSGDEAIRSWTSRWLRTLRGLQADASRPSADTDTDQLARLIADFARERLARADCALAQAQFVVARAHGFASWPQLVHHIGALTSAASNVSAFERGADAVVNGDLATLEELLARDPGLVRARSTREHQATLLHYVSANGVENFRQRTPANIVAVTRRLLDAGADVHADADVYGGGATVLDLVATSAHPRQAGVQDALVDLLLDRGARMAAGLVRSCLANGCPEAAAHLAARGGAVDLEAAAGLGRLDLVARYVEPPRIVSQVDAAAALVMAAWYDRRDVVALLLDRGVDPGVCTPGDGRTALHVASYLGNAALVELLLARRAPVNVPDAVYGTPPAAWAVQGWLVERRGPADAYRAVLRMLADAGAEVRSRWLDDDRLRADEALYTALSRRAAGP